MICLRDVVSFPTEKSVIGFHIILLLQLNQLNIHRYSVESEKMDPGDNVEPMSAPFGASSDLHGQNVTAQRWL